MKRFVFVMALLDGCSGTSAPVAAGPALATPDPAPAAAATACYQGISSGAGQRVRTLLRRTVDPAAHRIVEDIAHDDDHGVKEFHLALAVDGDRFTMTEAAGEFTGSGTLTGPAWRWTSWVSVSSTTIDHARIEIESHDELTRTGLIAHKQIRKDGALVATSTDELSTIDCAGWDQAKAQLAVPVLDDALCDRACRRYATLKYWTAAEAEIAALPASQRDDARRRKTAELPAKLDGGAPACIAQCRSANNAPQAACMARATSPEQLGACAAM